MCDYAGDQGSDRSRRTVSPSTRTVVDGFVRARVPETQLIALLLRIVEAAAAGDPGCVRINAAKMLQCYGDLGEIRDAEEARPSDV